MFKSGLVAEQIKFFSPFFPFTVESCLCKKKKKNNPKQNYPKLEEILDLGLGLEEVDKVN